MEFQMDKIKKFKINGASYRIHEFVLQKASIFESLNDITEKNPDIVIPNATSDDLSKIFKLLYGRSHNEIFKKSPIKKIVRIVSVMMHMGINVEDIKKSITLMLDHTVDIVNDIMFFESYFDAFNLIIELHQYNKEYADDFNNLIIAIKKASFPNSFKIAFINKIISRSLKFENYDFIMGINFNYRPEKFDIDLRNTFHICMNTSSEENKSNKRWLPELEKVVQKYLKSESKFHLVYSPEKITIDAIKINDKAIEMIKHDKTFTKGTLGGNTLMSVVNHISKVLLGLAVL